MALLHKLIGLENALLIFARNPIEGKVKTRLAATLGNDKALRIYLELLAHTSSITQSVDCDRFVFYSDGVTKNDLWNDQAFFKQEQYGDDLGERMLNAFDTVFKLGYKRVIIIGTDCFELTSQLINQAFDGLKKHSVVIGPSFDGGYYLLGMNQLHAALFVGKEWSTDSVYTSTIHDLSNQQISYHQLPTLSDIDTEADWNHYINTKTNQS